MVTITNLTPHPVTIIRRCDDPNGPPDAIVEQRTEYPARAPGELSRATEAHERGDMCLTDAASDGQGGYETACALDRTGLIDWTGYVGVAGLPDFVPGDRMFGVGTFYIVSIVTVLGALAAGRGVEDLLVPSGQVRDASGRVIGATGLAPASALLSPMYRAVTAPYRAQVAKALAQRNELAHIIRHDASPGLLPSWADGI